jgi:hypothetical protein
MALIRDVFQLWHLKVPDSPVPQKRCTDSLGTIERSMPNYPEIPDPLEQASGAIAQDLRALQAS